MNIQVVQTTRTNLEVDFIAKKFDKVVYIQSAMYIPDSAKMEQELKPLKLVDNSFKKVIITKYDGSNNYDEFGILHLNLFDFLLNENSLD